MLPSFQFLSGTHSEPDPIPDDQALFAETPRGLIVFLGCAHAGVVNTLRHVYRLTGERKIYALSAVSTSFKPQRNESLGRSKCSESTRLSFWR